MESLGNGGTVEGPDQGPGEEWKMGVSVRVNEVIAAVVKSRQDKGKEVVAQHSVALDHFGWLHGHNVKKGIPGLWAQCEDCDAVPSLHQGIGKGEDLIGDPPLALRR